MHEVGATVLKSIPEAVAAHTLVDFGSLPRIMASCDAVVKDEASGGTPHFMLSVIARIVQFVSTFCAVQVPSCASLKQSTAFLS